MSESPVSSPDLSVVIIDLLKAVIYRDDDLAGWSALMELQSRVREYVAVLGLELLLDEAEGYAFLRARPEADEGASTKLPRLVARRPLSFPVSLLLALLRKRLAEFDAAGGDTRLVVSREEMVEQIRLFLPDSSNEARLVDQIETHVNKIVDLGFLRKLKPVAGSTATAAFEVRRILKAFVDAQWLAEFDVRLAAYQAFLAGETAVANDD